MRERSIRSVVMLFLALVITCPALYAQISKFQVNTLQLGTQSNPAVATDAAGNFVIAWASSPNAGGLGEPEGIYMRRYSPSGAALDPREIFVADGHDPAVAMNAAGDFVITWVGTDAVDPFGFPSQGVFAQRFAATGTPLESSFRLHVPTEGDQTEPAIGMNAAGNFVIAWTSRTFSNGSVTSSPGVFVASFDSSGSPLGGAHVATTDELEDHDQPAVAIDATGKFVVAWRNRHSSFTPDVLAQRFNADGTQQTPGLPSLVATNVQDPAVGMDASGNFVVAYAPRFGNVFGQRFNAAGAAQGLAEQFNTGSLASVNSFPGTIAMAMGATGGFVVTWQGADSNDHAFTLKACSNGTRTIIGQTHSSSTSGRKTAVSIDNFGIVVVAWDGDFDSSEEGVFATSNVGCSVPIFPSLSINDVSIVEGDSGTKLLKFTVTLSTISNQKVTVDYATFNDTATFPPDYQSSIGNLVFLPNDLSHDVEVTINGDLMNEADETFFVQLSSPTNAVISKAQGIGTIVNDDPVPTVSIDDVIFTEGSSGTPSLNVDLSAASGQEVKVFLDTEDGSAKIADNDYAALSSFLVIFSPGTTRRQIPVNVIDDTVLEPIETFFVKLSNPVNATIGRSPGIVTIADNDGNTPAGNGGLVRPIDPVTGATPVTLIFAQVNQAGNTTLTSSTSCPASPAGFRFGDPPTCYDLKTNAVFTGVVHVCIDYVPAAFPPGVEPALFHGEVVAGVLMWRNVTTSVDTATHRVCGVVTSLSPFVLLAPSNRPPVAKCHNVSKSAGDSCNAVVDAAEVNDGSSDPDGDPLTFTLTPAGPFALGLTPVILTAKDNKGGSSQCSMFVKVVDDTPPTISCSRAVTVEFTSAAGAPVEFGAPAAMDSCGATITVSSHASGSTFPIGSTTVLWSATDMAGNQAFCTLSVTVLGARAVKENVLADLVALRAGVTNGDDRQQLDEAIGELRASLNPALWIDQTHLQPRGGDDVFDNEKKSVSDLQKLMKNKKSSIADAALQSAINGCVKADRLLAEIAIIEAAPNGRASDIDEARRELARGDNEATAGKFEQAIERYSHAWKKAMEALAH